MINRNRRKRKFNLNDFQDLSLLISRLVIAYGFYEPAMRKWADINAIAIWFETLHIPFPLISAYLAASTEITGVILISLGLFTRLISLPLIFVMLVAIFTVHLPHGFAAGDNGFEIPLYYMMFLFIFFSFGAGKYSLDYLIFGENN